MSCELKKQADEFLEERVMKRYSAQSQGIPLAREAPQPLLPNTALAASTQHICLVRTLFPSTKYCPHSEARYQPKQAVSPTQQLSLHNASHVITFGIIRFLFIDVAAFTTNG